MTEFNELQNLKGHYTTETKINLPKHVVATPPENVPKYNVYKDSDANTRLYAINKDIYESEKKVPSKKRKKFLGIF